MRPLFQHTDIRLLGQIQSIAMVTWLNTQLQRVFNKVIPYIAKLYDDGTLYRDTLKIIVNFVQIVGSFSRHAHAQTQPHTHACARIHAHVYVRVQDRAQLPERVSEHDENLLYC